MFFVFCFLINLFIFIFGWLGLRCCMQAFSSCSEWRLLFIAVRRLLIAIASLVAEHRLQVRGLQQLWHTGSVVVARRLQSAGSVVVAHRLSCSMACGIFPDQGSNPCPPALAGGFLTTAPPGKSQIIMFYTLKLYSTVHQLCLNKTGRKKTDSEKQKI